MLYLPYLEGALLVAAVAALPVGIRLRRSPRRFLLVRHRDLPKPRPKPNPGPKPESDPELESKGELEARLESVPLELEATSDTGGIVPPSPRISPLSSDMFQLVESSVTPGYWLVYRQLDTFSVPGIVDGPPFTQSPLQTFYLPIPDYGAGQFFRPNYRPVGMVVLGRPTTGTDYQRPAQADPALTGMSLQGYPFVQYPSIDWWNGPWNSQNVVGNVTVVANTGQINSTAAYLLSVRYNIRNATNWFGGIGSRWIFFTINGIGQF